MRLRLTNFLAQMTARMQNGVQNAIITAPPRLAWDEVKNNVSSFAIYQMFAVY